MPRQIKSSSTLHKDIFFPSTVNIKKLARTGNLISFPVNSYYDSWSGNDCSFMWQCSVWFSQPFISPFLSDFHLCANFSGHHCRSSIKLQLIPLYSCLRIYYICFSKSFMPQSTVILQFFYLLFFYFPAFAFSHYIGHFSKSCTAQSIFAVLFHFFYLLGLYF